MRRRKDPTAVAFLVFGIMAILYGLFLGPVLNWLLDLNAGVGLHIVCIAVGLLSAFLGVGRLKGWSD